MNWICRYYAIIMTLYRKVLFFRSAISNRSVYVKFWKRNNQQPVHTIWYKYEDDILVYFKKSSKPVKNVLTLNNKINFAPEKSQESKLHFLDLKITRKNSQCIFEVYNILHS